MNSSIFIWIIIAISLAAYFTVKMVYRKLGVVNLETALSTTNGLQLLNLKHLFGIILFGIIFFLILPEFRFLVEFVEVPHLDLLLPFILITSLVAYLSRLSFKNLILEKANINNYSTLSVWAYLILRFAFLLCLEFFFRGVILFKFLEYETPCFAIFSSVSLYVLVSVFDSNNEFFRKGLLAILLCLFSYQTNSIWYPFLIQMSYSAVFEISQFYDITFNKQTS